MSDAGTTTTDPFEIATASARAEVRAALSGIATQRSHEAGVSGGGAVGHGVIRLLGDRAVPELEPEPAAGGTEPGAPVGHGAIRLLT